MAADITYTSAVSNVTPGQNTEGVDNGFIWYFNTPVTLAPSLGGGGGTPNRPDTGFIYPRRTC